MGKKNKISAEDQALFRAAIDGTVPLQSNTVNTKAQQPKPRPIAKKLAEDNQLVMQELMSSPEVLEDIEAEGEMVYRAGGLQKSQFNKLRRGQFAIQDHMDLHGMTIAEAKPALADFISDCISARKYCVRIIHGKGLGSPDKKPVLKNMLNHWLRQRSEVLAFCSAPINDGGTGACYVLLRRRKHG
ncbi:MAG: Smr/MutS family protein [Gammaproteobacteria bacterium]|nr:Smr/MutS family protein [Gammaproteobacteria bacterium]MDH5730092.1 Smr/MutS family protein [Gammaproteobacteria bacterium]